VLGKIDSLFDAAKLQIEITASAKVSTFDSMKVIDNEAQQALRTVYRATLF
jgi:hypothetical protein